MVSWTLVNIETVSVFSVATNHRGILTKSPSVSSDIKLSKTMLIYYPMKPNVSLYHNQIFIIV